VVQVVRREHHWAKFIVCSAIGSQRHSPFGNGGVTVSSISRTPSLFKCWRLCRVSLFLCACHCHENAGFHPPWRQSQIGIRDSERSDTSICARGTDENLASSGAQIFRSAQDDRLHVLMSSALTKQRPRSYNVLRRDIGVRSYPADHDRYPQHQRG
jgi:hypothetical protein